LSVENSTFTRYVPLFRANFATAQPDYGYFTVYAVTSSILSDNVNVHAIRTRAHTSVDYAHISEQLLKNNRKVLESDAINRREAKIARRNALLPTMFRYLGTMEKYSNNIGSVNAVTDMRDAFALVEEAAKRGMEAVTIDMLKVFINRYLQDTLAGAGKKVNLAMDRFDDARGEMGEMWLYLRSQLFELAGETKIALLEIANEAGRTTRALQIDRVSPEVLQSKAVPASDGSGGGAVLVFIMALELIAYVIFFIIKHRKTGGFKKID
jgi:hypothetical protein